MGKMSRFLSFQLENAWENAKLLSEREHVTPILETTLTEKEIICLHQ